MGSPQARRRSRTDQALAMAGVVLIVTAAVLGAGCLQQFQNRGQPGEWAREFLRAEPYSRLIVEIDHENGAAPESATIDKIERVLGDRLNKPDGIEVTSRPEVQGKGKGAKYSFSEIRDLESDHRDHRKNGSTTVLYILFLDGGSDQDSGDSRILGAAYSGSSLVMFKDNIRRVEERCRQQTLGLPVGCPPLRVFEDAVMTHEIGHALGLVNLGVPMGVDREDPESPGHSTNENSVMYKAVRTGDIINFIIRGNPIPTQFDQHDVADLRTAGGK